MTIYNSNIWKFKNRNQLVTILNSISFDITLTLPASASSLFCFPDPETYKFSSALIIICFDRIFLFQFALDVFLSFTVHMMSSYTNSLTKHLMKPKKIVAGFFSMITHWRSHLCNCRQLSYVTTLHSLRVESWNRRVITRFFQIIF